MRACVCVRTRARALLAHGTPTPRARAQEAGRLLPDAALGLFLGLLCNTRISHLASCIAQGGRAPGDYVSVSAAAASQRGFVPPAARTKGQRKPPGHLPAKCCPAWAVEGLGPAGFLALAPRGCVQRGLLRPLAPAVGCVCVCPPSSGHSGPVLPPAMLLPAVCAPFCTPSSLRTDSGVSTPTDQLRLLTPVFSAPAAPRALGCGVGASGRLGDG